DFDDYREYLRAMIKFLKATQPNFSYRYFSKTAGFSSPNFLKLVAEGQRNLSERSITKFARGLGLQTHEQELFGDLVRLDQARSDREKNQAYQRFRRRSREKHPRARLEDVYFRVQSLWYTQPIRELTQSADFQEDSAWIGRRLSPTIRPAEAQRAIEMMLEVGLLRRDESGRLNPSESPLDTGVHVRALADRNCQRAMLDRAREAVDTGQDALIRSHVVALDSEGWAEIQRRAKRFEQEMLDYAKARSENLPPGAKVDAYHIGVDAFALSRAKDVS
ncbi:MAG: TIGR02147 family protein, partial [Myxococcota bacterium]